MNIQVVCCNMHISLYTSWFEDPPSYVNMATPSQESEQDHDSPLSPSVINPEDEIPSGQRSPKGNQTIETPMLEPGSTRNISDFSYYTPHMSKVKGEIEHFKKCLKSIQAALEIGYPAQGFEINLKPNIELTIHRRQRIWGHILQEASDQLMELCTEQLEENIDCKEEKRKGIIASLTKLSGTETASAEFVKFVEANALDKGLNNGNNSSSIHSTINKRTPYAQHAPKKPKSKHNAQPQPLLNAQPFAPHMPINPADLLPFRPHFYRQAFRKPFTNPY